MPNQGRTAKGLVFDIAPVGRPLAYRKSERFKSLGMCGESDDITGGMGLEGAVELQRFVESGGVLITLGGASAFPAEFGLARRVEAARPSAQFYAPGPIVEAEIARPEHPMFYGVRQPDAPGEIRERSVAARAGSGPRCAGPHDVQRRRRGGIEWTDA